MIKIIPAKKQHLSELVILFEAYRTFYKKEINIEKSTQFLVDRIENKESFIFIAIEITSEKIVGFVQLYPMFSSTRLDKILILNDLFVDVAFRGNGISQLLIDRCKLFAHDFNALELVLETQKSNVMDRVRISEVLEQDGQGQEVSVMGNQLYPKVGFELDTEHNYYSWTNSDYQF